MYVVGCWLCIRKLVGVVIVILIVTVTAKELLALIIVGWDHIGDKDFFKGKGTGKEIIFLFEKEQTFYFRGF